MRTRAYQSHHVLICLILRALSWLTEPRCTKLSSSSCLNFISGNVFCIYLRWDHSGQPTVLRPHIHGNYMGSWGRRWGYRGWTAGGHAESTGRQPEIGTSHTPNRSDRASCPLGAIGSHQWAPLLNEVVSWYVDVKRSRNK